MKEQIEEILIQYFGKSMATSDCADDIFDLMLPNNDWLEYPKHKPIEPYKPKNKYVEVLESLLNRSFNREYQIGIIDELKTKIENGDLK